jgi:hypothetical protein
MLLGTPHYMPPEQALNASDIDERADIYSLGVVLYELVVGQVPFTGDTPYSIIHDHIYTPLPLPSQVNPDIPPQIELVLLRALEKDPNERYDSAVQMVKEFVQAVNQSGLTELKPDRAKTAETSLMKIRASLAASVKPPPSLTTVQPQSAPSPVKPIPKLQPKEVPPAPKPQNVAKPAAPTRVNAPTRPMAVKKGKSFVDHLQEQRRGHVSSLYDQIISQRAGYEQLFARLPGFKGYQDRLARRQADRMLRDFIAEQLTQRVNRLAAIERAILDGGGLTFMSKTSAAKSSLQTFLDRVKAAAPGYSGFFEAVKIESDELEKLYAFDEAQIRYVDKIDESLSALDNAAKSKEGIAEAIAALDALIDEANQAFSLREEVLTNLDKTL